MNRTWAPRGQKPIRRHSGGWKKLSAAVGVTRRGFYFRLYPGAIQAAQLTHFLGHLKRQVHGRLLLVWDRLGCIAAGLCGPGSNDKATALSWRNCAPMPPELNPVEYLWGWWKPHTAAHGCPRTTEELHWLARQGLRQAQRRKTTLGVARTRKR